MARRFLKRMNQLKHRRALAGAKIISSVARFAVSEGCKVTFGQVVDMDVIAYASAVGSVLITAKYAELIALAYCDLCNVGHEVVWSAVWVFADESAWMRADGVEVAQSGDFE